LVTTNRRLLQFKNPDGHAGVTISGHLGDEMSKGTLPRVSEADRGARGPAPARTGGHTDFPNDSSVLSQAPR
jgi:hypothetical protein